MLRDLRARQQYPIGSIELKLNGHTDMTDRDDRGGMVIAMEVADHPHDYADTFIRNTMVLF